LLLLHGRGSQLGCLLLLLDQRGLLLLCHCLSCLLLLFSSKEIEDAVVHPPLTKHVACGT
jgi:hypothetical protein